mgnify:FL=1|jgi:AcrR family transcriptional regulator
MCRKTKNSQALQSRRMITEALLRLMKKEPYVNITITQICLEAQVVRQTFYRNYHSKQEVLECFVMQLIDEYQSKYAPGNDMQHNLEQLFTYIPFSQELLLLLKQNGLFFLLEDAFSQYLDTATEKIVFMELLGSSRYHCYLKDFIIFTMLSILSRWIDNGFSETPAELSLIAQHFFSGTDPLYNQPGPHKF